MGVSSEPWNATIQSSPNLTTIVVKDYIFPIHSAGEPRLCNFNLRFLETGHASICYGNSPQRRRGKICRSGYRINVAGFKFHLCRNPRVGLSEARGGDRE